MEQKGEYGASLIKKGKYWPKGVPGAVIGTYFEDTDMNRCEMLGHQLMD